MEFIHNNKRTDIDIDVLIKHYNKDQVRKIYKDKLSESQMRDLLSKFPKGKKEEKEGAED